MSISYGSPATCSSRIHTATPTRSTESTRTLRGESEVTSLPLAND